ADASPRRIGVPPFTVFVDLPPSVLVFVGSKRALPLPGEAYRVEWTIGSQPREIRRASTSTGTVAFRNASSCSWPHVVHLGYHWRPLDAERNTENAGSHGVRAFPERTTSGAWTEDPLRDDRRRPSRIRGPHRIFLSSRHVRPRCRFAAHGVPRSGDPRRPFRRSRLGSP